MTDILLADLVCFEVQSFEKFMIRFDFTHQSEADESGYASLIQ